MHYTIEIKCLHDVTKKPVVFHAPSGPKLMLLMGKLGIAVASTYGKDLKEIDDLCDDDVKVFGYGEVPVVSVSYFETPEEDISQGAAA